MKLLPLNILLQYSLPHKWLSHAVGTLSRCQIKWFKQLLIKWFCNHYQVNLSEAEHTQAKAYESFHDFFTRHLNPHTRTFDYGPNHLLSPIDGTLSQLHTIQQNSLLQAKQYTYSVSKLLGDPQLASQFENGYGLTFYLAPRDYHRVHMPAEGRLLQTSYIPGQLFSVNRKTTEHIPHLFTRNERLVCLFETQNGLMAIILVGAMIVGNIYTSWSGLVNPNRHNTHTEYTDYRSHNIYLQQGQELGYFAMGSTVIVLWQQPTHPQSINWLNTAPSLVKLGHKLGYYTTKTETIYQK